MQRKREGPGWGRVVVVNHDPRTHGAPTRVAPIGAALGGWRRLGWCFARPAPACSSPDSLMDVRGAARREPSVDPAPARRFPGSLVSRRSGESVRVKEGGWFDAASRLGTVIDRLRSLGMRPAFDNAFAVRACSRRNSNISLDFEKCDLIPMRQIQGARWKHALAADFVSAGNSRAFRIIDEGSEHEPQAHALIASLHGDGWGRYLGRTGPLPLGRHSPDFAWTAPIR